MLRTALRSCARSLLIGGKTGSLKNLPKPHGRPQGLDHFMPGKPNLCCREIHCSSPALGSGLNKNSKPSLKTQKDKVIISSADGEELAFHHIWLRDHCQCTKCVLPVVNQREIDIMNIPVDIKPTSVSLNEDKLVIQWPDKHQTEYGIDWLQQHHYNDQRAKSALSDERTEIHLWNAGIHQHLPEPISYEKIMHHERDVLQALECILKYGFVFINGVPPTAKGTNDVVSHMCESVMETLYGKVCVFSSNAEFADTAYSTDGIGGHHDTTYFMQSIGLQTFHCHSHDGSGGETLLIDTFHAAEMLRWKHPESFKLLSTVPVNFFYKDDSHLFKALSPIIRVHPLSRSIVQVRYNNADRGVLDTMPQENVPRFYQAMKDFVSFIKQPDNELWFKLVPGTMVLIDNWRVMHGRSQFDGNRVMCSSYVSRDDFLSKVRYLRNKFGSSNQS